MSFNKRIRLIAVPLLVAVLGCFTDAAAQPSSNSDQAVLPDNVIIESWIAQATADRPRQSEGDIVVLKDGALLAAWSDFYGGARDDSAAQVSAARSVDGGRTWEAPFTLQANAGAKNVMSVSFLRLPDGALLFFYLVKNSKQDLDVVVRRSRDEAKTWSEPTLITADPGYHVMNNARVLRLRNGRLLCPVSWSPEIASPREHFRNVIFLSDDDGRTWRRGQGEVDAPRRGAMEPGLIERRDGTVWQIVRTQTGRIWQSLSQDGGDRWTEATPTDIPSPEAPATIAQAPNGDWLLVYNPDVRAGEGHQGPRTPLAAAWSDDEGKTWSAPKIIEGNADLTYAYTSVGFDRGRVLLTYYVAPRQGNRLSLKFKSLPWSWFKEGF